VYGAGIYCSPTVEYAKIYAQNKPLCTRHGASMRSTRPRNPTRTAPREQTRAQSPRLTR